MRRNMARRVSFSEPFTISRCWSIRIFGKRPHPDVGPINSDAHPDECCPPFKRLSKCRRVVFRMGMTFLRHKGNVTLSVLKSRGR